MNTSRQDRRRSDSFGPGMRFFSDELLEQTWPPILGLKVKRRILLFSLMLASLWVDFITGPTIRFPAFYAVPILLFSWYDGFFWGGLAGIGIVLARLTMERSIWPFVPWPMSDTILNACTAVMMILIVAWYSARAGRLTREVRLLWGILPICMYCHRIRNTENHWERLEGYIMDRSKAQFTHGICPRCMKEKVPAR